MLKDRIEKVIAEKAELVKQVEAFLIDIEKGKVELANLTGLITAKDEMIAGLSASIESGKLELAKIKADYEAAIDGLKKEKETVKAELETASKALENPAFADAVIKGEKEIKSGDSKATDLKELEKEMSAIKDPAKKISFYRKYFEKN